MAQEKTPNGIPYEYETAGQSGSRFYLIVKKGQFSKSEIEDAKKWLKSEHDAVTITVENNIYKKLKGDAA